MFDATMAHDPAADHTGYSYSAYYNTVHPANGGLDQDFLALGNSGALTNGLVSIAPTGPLDRAANLTYAVGTQAATRAGKYPNGLYVMNADNTAFLQPINTTNTSAADQARFVDIKDAAASLPWENFLSGIYSRTYLLDGALEILYGMHIKTNYELGTGLAPVEIIAL